MNIFSWLWDKVTTSDEERVAAARRVLDAGIMDSPRTLQWLKQSGWSASGGDAAVAMRNPVTRDAAIFASIQNFKDSRDDSQEMMRRYTANGLNNGTTTHAYLLNMGEGTLGNSRSNQQAVMLVDESARPPLVTIAFRGTNPTLIPTKSNQTDLLTHLGGMWDYICGKRLQSYEQQTELFWQGARGDITRILDGVAARNPGVAPKITLAGHSYGADAATRMVPRLAERYPAWREQLSLVGYGAMASFSPAERRDIYALLGSDPERARQYLARNDWIRPLFSINQPVGERRELHCRTGHEYNDSTNLEAMMDALQAQMASDPRHAEARARALVQEYTRHPESVLGEMAAMTASGALGQVTGAQVAGTGRRVLH